MILQKISGAGLQPTFSVATFTEVGKFSSAYLAPQLL